MAKDKKEPWEQSIYDTREQEVLTRKGSKQRNQASKVYMILLVICLFLLISLPTGWYIYQKLNQEDTKSIEQFASSSKSQTASTESQPSESQASTSSTEASSTETTTTSSSTEDTITSSSEAATDDASTTEVVAGEGVNQISARTGVSVETLLKLNGFSSIDQWFAVPGQKIKIK